MEFSVNHPSTAESITENHSGKSRLCKSKLAGWVFIGFVFAFSVVVSGCAATYSASARAYYAAQNSPATRNQSNTGSLQQPVRPRTAGIIRPGDQLEITVWGYPEFNTTATVDQYGTVMVPLIGEVAAAGLTTAEFKDAMKQHLSAYVKGEARITVSHIEMNQKISVLGSVNRQASYPVFNDISLMALIAEAGGPTSDADLRHIKIFRDGDTRSEEVDLTKHLEDGDLEGVPKVRPGDTVFIPAEDDIVKDLSTFGYEILILFGFFKLV